MIGNDTWCCLRFCFPRAGKDYRVDWRGRYSDCAGAAYGAWSGLTPVEKDLGDLLAMKDRALRLGEVALTQGTLELSPPDATGMAVGAQVPQSHPAAIATAGMGTEVPRGVHSTQTSVGW
jgi:hypothetical protein